MKTVFPIICLTLLIIEIISLFVRLYITSKNEPENCEKISESQGKILVQFLFTGGALGFVLGAIFDVF